MIEKIGSAVDVQSLKKGSVIQEHFKKAVVK